MRNLFAASALITVVISVFFTPIIVADNPGGNFISTAVENGVEEERYNLFAILKLWLLIAGAVAIPVTPSVFITSHLLAKLMHAWQRRRKI